MPTTIKQKQQKREQGRLERERKINQVVKEQLKNFINDFSTTIPEGFEGYETNDWKEEEIVRDRRRR